MWFWTHKIWSHMYKGLLFSPWPWWQIPSLGMLSLPTYPGFFSHVWAPFFICVSFFFTCTGGSSFHLCRLSLLLRTYVLLWIPTPLFGVKKNKKRRLDKEDASEEIEFKTCIGLIGSTQISHNVSSMRVWTEPSWLTELTRYSPSYGFV